MRDFELRTTKEWSELDAVIECWNHDKIVTNVLKLKNKVEQLEQENEDLKAQLNGQTDGEWQEIVLLRKWKADLLQRARKIYGEAKQRDDGSKFYYQHQMSSSAILSVLEKLFGEENLNPKEGE